MPCVVAEVAQGEGGGGRQGKWYFQPRSHPWTPDPSSMQNQNIRLYKEEARLGRQPCFGLGAPRSTCWADQKLGHGQCCPKELRVRKLPCKPPVTNSHFLFSFKKFTVLMYAWVTTYFFYEAGKHWHLHLEGRIIKELRTQITHEYWNTNTK